MPMRTPVTWLPCQTDDQEEVRSPQPPHLPPESPASGPVWDIQFSSAPVKKSNKSWDTPSKKSWDTPREFLPSSGMKKKKTPNAGRRSGKASSGMTAVKKPSQAPVDTFSTGFLILPGVRQEDKKLEVSSPESASGPQVRWLAESEDLQQGSSRRHRHQQRTSSWPSGGPFSSLDRCRQCAKGVLASAKTGLQSFGGKYGMTTHITFTAPLVKGLTTVEDEGTCTWGRWRRHRRLQPREKAEQLTTAVATSPPRYGELGLLFSRRASSSSPVTVCGQGERAPEAKSSESTAAQSSKSTAAQSSESTAAASIYIDDDTCVPEDIFQSMLAAAKDPRIQEGTHRLLTFEDCASGGKRLVHVDHVATVQYESR